ncbi:uncharacterized protein LOC141879997 isoform X2 [Acropora palmata]|uniref:uncharacterized protein LOC141879997 isoform X2 n=1 Tax=Acropora palmata TaxID=6131 RepID=UPI003DA09725
MAFPLGFALLGLFFRLIFEVEAATCKHNKNNVESEAGLDGEYSSTNRGGSAWGHRSGEERNSIFPIWVTVLVTLILAVLYRYRRMMFPRLVAMALEDDYGPTFEGQSSSSDTIIPIREETSIMEESSGNYQGISICQCHLMVTGQASKPLVNLVNDHSDVVENIFQHLDTFIEGAGDYEVIAKYFGFSIYTIRSRFEKSFGGPSRAMIEAIVARHPEITVESFAKLVEKKARRRDVAILLRDYDLDSLKESEDLSYIQ